jgi:uncharacterized protein (DUF1697 family)
MSKRARARGAALPLGTPEAPAAAAAGAGAGAGEGAGARVGAGAGAKRAKQATEEAFIALLRGINVGGVRVSMPDLKRLLEDELGVVAVQTVLATGNVVFNATDTTTTQLTELLEPALSKRFHYSAFVQVFKLITIRSVVKNYGLQRKNGIHAYLVFVSDREIFVQMREEQIALSVANANANANTKATDEEEVLFCDENEDCLVINWSVAIGFSTKTNFAKLINKSKYKNAITTRNINTLEKMILLMTGSS